MEIVWSGFKAMVTSLGGWSQVFKWLIAEQLRKNKNMTLLSKYSFLFWKLDIFDTWFKDNSGLLFKPFVYVFGSDFGKMVH